MKEKSGQSDLYLMMLDLKYASHRVAGEQNTRTRSQHLTSEGGMHPPEIFQTHHVFNILIGKEQTRERVRNKKKQQHNSSSTSLSHYGFCVAYLQTRELSESICSLSTIYFPPENSQAVLFECLHGLT